MALPTHADFQSNLCYVTVPTEEDCPICIAPYDAPPAGKVAEVTHRAVQTPCGHVYGESCLKAWLEGNATCPTCRRVLYEVERVEEEERLLRPERARGFGFGEEVDDDWIGLAAQSSLIYDSANRADLAHLFGARARAVAHRDQAQVVRLENRITAAWSSRLDFYLWGYLTINNDEFRNRPFHQGAVLKIARTPRNQRFPIDSEAIEKCIRWYLNRTLESAAGDTQVWPDEPVEMWLHPLTLYLAEHAIVMVRRHHGVRASAKAMRREMVKWLEWFSEDGDPEGLDTIVWDLAEIAALTLCGMQVQVRTVAFGCETYQGA